jgi:hypothetical protein
MLLRNNRVGSAEGCLNCLKYRHRKAEQGAEAVYSAPRNHAMKKGPNNPNPSEAFSPKIMGTQQEDGIRLGAWQDNSKPSLSSPITTTQLDLVSLSVHCPFEPHGGFIGS